MPKMIDGIKYFTEEEFLNKTRIVCSICNKVLDDESKITINTNHRGRLKRLHHVHSRCFSQLWDKR